MALALRAALEKGFKSFHDPSKRWKRALSRAKQMGTISRSPQGKRDHGPGGMAQENGDIGGLVPEIYYDLIARVAAGVPVVLAILVPLLADPGKPLDPKLLNISSFLFLVGLGYVAGHFLTSISTLSNAIIWKIYLRVARRATDNLNYKFRSRSVRKIFAQIYARIDWAARRDSGSGTVLKKMEAGAALTDNMLSGWLVIIFYHVLGGEIIWKVDFSDWNDIIVVVVVTMLLVFSVVMRRLVFVVRQDRILKLLGFSPNDVGGERDDVDGEGAKK